MVRKHDVNFPRLSKQEKTSFDEHFTQFVYSWEDQKNKRFGFGGEGS